MTPTAAAAAFRIGVSSSSAALLDMAADAFRDQAGLGELPYVTGSSGLLYDELDGGRLDAILVPYVPSKEYWFNPVALDGLVVVLHPANGIANLSRSQVQAIFGGQLADWSELGGSDSPIVLFTRERGSGTRRIFLERIMQGQPIAINAQVRSDNAALVQSVANTSGAIGYGLMGSSGGVAVASIDGVPPSPDTTGDQSYPLSLPLYFVSLAEPEGELRAFLAWLQSLDGQAILGEKYGRVR